MNGNRQMEVHYIDTGFPYTATESFMDFFQGLSPTHVPLNYSPTGMMHDQGTFYSPYQVNHHLPRMDVSRSTWDYLSTLNLEQPSTIDMQPVGDAVAGVHAIPEECIANHQSNSVSQVVWQDNVDPDNMTYEELLDLGEVVGSQSRGLSQELINLLPTTKYKFGSFFSRKKSRERCVICQMRYKRGERQKKLPCKHMYHSECITKWLSINKICPVCNNEVYGEETRHEDMEVSKF